MGDSQLAGTVPGGTAGKTLGPHCPFRSCFCPVRRNAVVDRRGFLTHGRFDPCGAGAVFGLQRRLWPCDKPAAATDGLGQRDGAGEAGGVGNCDHAGQFHIGCGCGGTISAVAEGGYDAGGLLGCVGTDFNAGQRRFSGMA